MYHVSAQGVDERMINVHYYYITITPSVPVNQRQIAEEEGALTTHKFATVIHSFVPFLVVFVFRTLLTLRS